MKHEAEEGDDKKVRRKKITLTRLQGYAGIRKRLQKHIKNTKIEGEGKDEGGNEKKDEEP